MSLRRDFMKKFTRKQMIAAGAVVVLGVGGITVGVVNHNHAVQAQQIAKAKAHDAQVKADKKAQAEKLAKEKEATQQKQVAALLATATKNPTDAIAKLTDQTEKTKDADLVKGLNNRLALIKKAQAAVKDYQAHATDANKQKVAQAAINALTDKNDASVKAQLQKLFDDSNKQAQEAAQVKQQISQESKQTKVVDSSGQEIAPTPQENNSNSSDSSTSSNVTPSYNGGETSANTGTNTNSNGSSQGNSNSSNGNSNSNNNSNNSGNNVQPTPTPQPTVKYMGWVSVDGVVKYSQNFDSDAQAIAYASGVYNSKEVEDLMFAGHSISWGVRPVQVQ